MLPISPRQPPPRQVPNGYHLPNQPVSQVPPQLLPPLQPDGYSDMGPSSSSRVEAPRAQQVSDDEDDWC